jgi:hypothetical protein
LESDEERRKARHDRRVAGDRRGEVRRADDRDVIARARAMAKLRVLLVILLVLVLPVVLIRTGVTTAPSWLPLWWLYPEMLFQGLSSTLGD